MSWSATSGVACHGSSLSLEVVSQRFQVLPGLPPISQMLVVLDVLIR